LSYLQLMLRIMQESGCMLIDWLAGLLIDWQIWLMEHNGLCIRIILVFWLIAKTYANLYICLWKKDKFGDIANDVLCLNESVSLASLFLCSR